MTYSQPFELLKQARARFTQRQIAEHVGRNSKTIGRWEKGKTPYPKMLEPALRDMLGGPATGTMPKSDHGFRFVDLFAGIVVAFEKDLRVMVASAYSRVNGMTSRKKPTSKIMATTTCLSVTLCHFLPKMFQTMICCWQVFHANPLALRV